MIYKTHKLIILVILATLLTSTTANAGLLSLISKAGKSAKKVDVDLSANKIELPEAMGDFTPASIKPDSSGQWDIKLADGTRVSFDDLARRNEGKVNKSFLVLQANDIPNDFRMLENIPESLPVYIRGKGNKAFELQRGEATALKYKQVRLPVSNINQLKDGMWHLQRPAFAHSVRLFQLDTDASKFIQANAYGSKAVVEKIGANTLLDSMRSLRRQTVVISAPIKNGRLQGSGKASAEISINQLKKHAAENDINLVIIDSEKPARLLKRLAKDATERNNSVNAVSDTTGDFFNKFREPGNTAPLELNISDTGNSQTLVQLKPLKNTLDSKLADTIKSDNTGIIHIPAHLISGTVKLYRPDRERSAELDLRIVPWIQSDIQYYLIISTVLGLVVISSSWGLWNKIWRLRKREQYSYLLVFWFFWLLHRLLFIALFIPVLGCFSFLYALVMVVVKTINLLFVKPVIWIVGKVIR